MSSGFGLNPRFLGVSVPRFEDQRLLTGNGGYVDDLSAPGALHAAFLRSPYAHARIESVDISGALNRGAVAAWAAEDLGSFWKEYPFPVPPEPFLHPHNTVPLAKEKTRYVGEPVAVAVAESRAAAEDALDGIQIQYEVLPATVHPADAMREEAPLIHEDLGDNLAARLRIQVGDLEKVMARAPHRESLRLTVQRAGGGAMEARGILADYDRRIGRLTVHASTQTPHLLRRDLALILDRPESTIDVIAPDVGGGFGPKAYTYSEDGVVSWAAIQLGRPVKWIEDRLEYIQADVQEREQIHDVEVGFDDQGRLLALRDHFLSDTGAYVPWSVVVALLTVTGIAGPYRLPNFDATMEVVYTNRVPIAPVRGAGRPQATFVMERIMDRIAEVLDLDRAEVRRRNLIQPDEFPYEVGIVSQDGNSLTYDSGDYPHLLDKALDAVGYEEFRRGKRRLGEEGDPKNGKYVGIGVSFNNEPTGLGPFEGAVVRVDPTGRVVVLTGTSPNGQGHETVLAQVMADVLNLTPEMVLVETGDTRNIPYGIGTFASRTAVTAANSVWLAGQALREKILTFGASCLEASAEDLEIEQGNIFVRGSPERSISLGELAARSLGLPGVTMRDQTPGLEASEYYTPSDPATSAACQACVVEVDAQTGYVKILRHVIAHDCGRIMNPQTVEGQTHGSLVHGIGTALIEEVAFDENGTPLASTFLDYLLPLATDVPDFEIRHVETPSPFNPLGVKGAGEGGIIGTCAVIASAVEDALRPLGVRITEMPLTPYRLWRIVQEGKKSTFHLR